MYNRYIPNGGSYSRIVVEDIPPPSAAGRAKESTQEDAQSGPSKSPLGGLEGMLGGAMEGVTGALSGVLKGLHLEGLDMGDVLLAVIVLFLILESGDNLELVITLGLMILFSLGDKED